MAKQTQKDSLHDCVLLVFFFCLPSAVLPLPSQYLMPCGIDLRPLQQQNVFSHFFFLAYLPGTVPCFPVYLLGSRAASSFLCLFSFVFQLLQLLCLAPCRPFSFVFLRICLASCRLFFLASVLLRFPAYTTALLGTVPSKAAAVSPLLPRPFSGPLSEMTKHTPYPLGHRV